MCRFHEPKKLIHIHSMGSIVQRKLAIQKLRLAVSAVIASVILVGCSDSKSEIADSSEVLTELQSVSLPGSSETASEVDRSNNEGSDEATGDEAIEFPANVNFFSVPSMGPPQKTTTRTSIDRQESIQLVGFVNSDPTQHDSAMALLKVNGRLISVGVGDTFQEITVVSIVGRSVELVREKERWTLAMMQQPITNQPVAVPSIRRPRSDRRGAASRNSRENATHANSLHAGELHVPETETPRLPEPNLDIPRGPAFPEPPNVLELPPVPNPEGV